MKKLIAIILCIILLSVGAAAETTTQIDLTDGEAMYEFYEALLRYTLSQYRFDVTREALLESALKAVLTNHPELFDEIAKGTYDALDENSRYLTAKEYENTYAEVLGEFSGIGINVSSFDGVTYVGTPIKGTPAYLAGIMAGDVIESVDGEDVSGYVLDKTTNLIRGEKGTTVVLGIKRGEQQLTFTIVRDTIRVNPVTYYKLDGGNAGYVSISSFNANTSSYLDEALFNLKKEGVDKIILDLRNNLGGLVSEAVKTASYFLPENTLIVTEDYKNPAHNVEYKSVNTGMRFKVAVLVNEYSASASEIVSGAVKDHKAGVLVGTTTFGKGTVQMPLHMKNGGAIWLTIARYLTPSGAYIHGVGIEPDYRIANKKALMDTSAFESISGQRVLSAGDSGKDVLAVEQRLEAMGYPIEYVDETYDYQTQNAVRMFQDKNGLFPYGVADLTTQIKIMDVAAETEVTVDIQIEKAKALVQGL